MPELGRPFARSSVTINLIKAQEETGVEAPRPHSPELDRTLVQMRPLLGPAGSAKRLCVLGLLRCGSEEGAFLTLTTGHTFWNRTAPLSLMPCHITVFIPQNSGCPLSMGLVSKYGTWFLSGPGSGPALHMALALMFFL